MCLLSWQQHLTGYSIKKWDESNSPIDHPFLKQAYQKKQWAFVADYIRLNVLYNEGGIYMDTDMYVIKNIEPFLNENCFLGFESTNIVSAGIIGAQAKHPFIKQCLDVYNSFTDTDIQTPVPIPKLITEQLNKYGLSGYEQQYVKDILLLPIDYFYPYSYTDRYRGKPFEKTITSNTYAVHLWNASWQPPYYNAAKLIQERNFKWGIKELFFAGFRNPKCFVMHEYYKLIYLSVRGLLKHFFCAKTTKKSKSAKV